MSDPISEQPKPLKVLRAKNGGHLYHVIAEKKVRGGGLEWLVKKPDDELLQTWLPMEKVLAIAEPAWEWNDMLMMMLSNAAEAVDEHVPKCYGKTEVYNAITGLIEQIDKLRGGEL